MTGRTPERGEPLISPPALTLPGMTCHVHEFDAREGGAFRVSLSYDDPGRAGKSSSRADTYHGHFARLVPGRQVVEVIEFETADPALGRAMTLTTTLTDAGGGTDVLIEHDGIPASVPPADNEAGTRMSLANLAALVEHQTGAGDEAGEQGALGRRDHPLGMKRGFRLP